MNFLRRLRENSRSDAKRRNAPERQIGVLRFSFRGFLEVKPEFLVSLRRRGFRFCAGFGSEQNRDPF